jgi:hypothetical protein
MKLHVIPPENFLSGPAVPDNYISDHPAVFVDLYFSDSPIMDEIFGKRSVANNADGRLEVFAIGNDTSLYHIWQTSPGGGWTNWGYRSGTQLRSPTVGQNADGRLEVFVIGGDGALYRQWQTSPGGGWSN